MATKAINALAKRGVEIKILMRNLQNELDGINAKLIASGEGQTFDLNEGTVTVTHTTEGRPSGKYDLRFYPEVFNALPPYSSLREEILQKGIAAFEPGYISGRQAVVQYRLR